MASAARQSKSAFDAALRHVDAYFQALQQKSLLRFLTCGSVDDGKSTLVGRLLYDSKMLLDDQLSALESESRKAGALAEELDFALLVDGLAAEREQGITIDVAYRFFATDKRKFIVADTPGHEQYTRNMVTGASTADLAVILIDARKGVLTQTRRHSYLAHLLGIKKLVLAINKMDLVDFSQARFDSIVADYRAFADQIGIAEFLPIPLSGLTGDNVTERSANLRRGSLLELFTVLYNLAEGIIAFIAGVLAGSPALVGFSFDSAIEATSGGVVLWRLEAERKGDLDEEAVERLERRTQRFVAATLLLAALYVGFDSVRSMWTGDRPDPSLLGIAVAASSAVVMPVLAYRKLRVARALRSGSLRAEMSQTLACTYLSVALLIGLGLNALFGWWWADPVAGLVIAGFLVREAREAWQGEHDDG